MTKNKNRDAWDEWAEADMALENCVNHLKEMGLTKAIIRDKFVEKALDVCPPKLKPLVISKKMVKEAIKQYLAKEDAKDTEILKKRNGGDKFGIPPNSKELGILPTIL